MTDLFAAGWFLAYLAAAIVLLRKPKSPDKRRSRVHAFIICAIGFSMVPGLTQRDLYPFVAWPLVAGMGSRVVTRPRMMAVDAQGIEHDIDYRAWQPLSVDELVSWLNGVFLELDAESQQQAGAHLLRLAEQGRQAALAGESIGNYDRYLGPLTAPLFLLHPRRWSDGRAPASRFTALRLYRETWDLEQRARDPSAGSRALVFEYPRLR